MSEGPLILAATALLGFSAALRAAEAALFSLTADQIESLERQGRHKILAAKSLLTFRGETLATILVSNYAANMAFVACLLALFSRVLSGHPVRWAAVSGVIAVVAIVVFGEFLARAFGRCFNETVALATARPLVGLTSFATPLRWPVLVFSKILLRLAGEPWTAGEIGGEIPGRMPSSPEELKTVIPAGNEVGGWEQGERELLTSVVEFGSMFAGEIMTPRPEILAFSDDTPHEEILREVGRCQFHRVLVSEGTTDQIRGLLHVKDLLLNPATDYRQLLRKPLVVPETKRLTDLLREFRRHRVHLAVVCDEFGRTAGLVTMQDLLEEIVGEMTDESLKAPQTIRSVGPETWLVLGRTTLADLRDQVGLNLPEQLARTLSGFVANRLGRIPQVGDSITENGFRLTVERMAVRRATILRVERTAPVAGEEVQEEQP